MDPLQQDHVSIDEFLSWVIDQEGRFELVNGQIIMMAGATVRHNVVVNNVTVSLTPAAKNNGCRSTTSDTAIQTVNGNIRYPDVVIDCGPPDMNAVTVSNPTILVEVSSSGTAQVDTVVKLDEYRNIPSVRMVIQIEPGSVLVSVHRRTDQSTWQTEIYENLGDLIELPPINGTLALKDIYDTLAVAPRPRVHIVSSNPI